METINLKTIKEIAQMFHVSLRTIYNKINYQLKEELENHVIISGRKTLLVNNFRQLFIKILLFSPKYDILCLIFQNP
jgi:transcriptional antiterminator